MGMTGFVSLRIRLLAILLAIGMPSLASTTPVGTIVLAAGQAVVISGETSEAARRGRALQVGDRVATQGGGHVHISLRDGGLVALRPNSTLRFDVFDYDAARPADGKVRYTLSEGVARSITGKIGEANKENFRLNTPISAIGVRGTDFVVRHAQETTQVALHSGAVVVGALGANCSADAFGACGGQTLVLAEGDRDRLAEVSLKNGIPQLNLRDGSVASPDRIVPPHRKEPATESLAPDTERHRTDALVSQLSESPPPAPPPATVFWGRWSGVTTPDEVRKVSDLLAEGKQVAVANRVFGMGVDGLPSALPDQGQASFGIREATAYLGSAAGLSSAHVTDGRLIIDFAARQFSTTLNVLAASEAFGIDAAGRVDGRGYLLSDPARSNARVVGVLDASLNQAGTLFERNLPDGRGLTGAVRWGR